MPCANYFMACWSAHCNLRSFSSLCGQSGSANYHWTSLDYCLHLHNLTSNTSCNSLFDASVFGPDQPVFPAPTEAKLGTSCTRVSPMELTLTLNWGIKHHSGPWSISLSQIMLSAWLFLSRPPSLRLCYFSHNVFSSPLFFPPAYASIRLSHPASLCSLLHDGSLSSAPPTVLFSVPLSCSFKYSISVSPPYFLPLISSFLLHLLCPLLWPTADFLALQCPLQMRLLITLGFGIWST